MSFGKQLINFWFTFWSTLLFFLILKCLSIWSCNMSTPPPPNFFFYLPCSSAWSLSVVNVMKTRKVKNKFSHNVCHIIIYSYQLWGACNLIVDRERYRFINVHLAWHAFFLTSETLLFTIIFKKSSHYRRLLSVKKNQEV